MKRSAWTTAPICGMKAPVVAHVGLLLLIVAISATAATSTPRVGNADVADWAPASALAVPTVPDDLPAGSVGCVVVGQHLDADGMRSKPRVMQGAFTSDVSATSQKAFMSAVLVASARWRFRYAGTGRTPAWGFHRTVVGFVSSPSGEPTVVLDAERQDRRVSSACTLLPLEEWTSRNAVPVADAEARVGDPVLTAKNPDDQAFWLTDGDQRPPRFPAKPGTSSVEACVIVGFMIRPSGVPSELRIMAINNFAPPSVRKLFEDASLAAAATWRYSPGPDNLKRLPEFRQVPITYSTTVSSRRRNCEIVDLSAPS